MIRPHHVLAVALSVCGMATLQAQPERVVTLGDPVVNRPLLTSPYGQVVIYAGPGFPGPGLVSTWSFYCELTNYPRITPLLFQRAGETDFILRGGGSCRVVYNTGIVMFYFDPDFGDYNIHSGDTFGFVNNCVSSWEGTNWLQIGAANDGVVQYGYASETDEAKWYFTEDEEFGMHIGQVYRLNGVTDGDTIALHEDPRGRRAYSFQMTAQVTLADILWLSAKHWRDPPVVICWATKFDQQYSVEWANVLGGPWLQLGDPIPGDGLRAWAEDRPADDNPRFYRLRISPK